MRKTTSLVLFLALAQTGCGAMIFHNPEAVTVRSNVVGAAVLEGNIGQGRAPGMVTLDRTRDHILTVSAEGYAPKTVTVESHFSWWRALVSVVLNGGHGLFTLFISTGIGIVTDLGAGAWQTLDDEVNVDLERASFTAPPESLELKKPDPVPTHVPGLDGPTPRPAPAPAPAPAPTASPPSAPPPSVEPERPASAKKFCTACGATIAKPGALFCGECGARQ